MSLPRLAVKVAIAVAARTGGSSEASLARTLFIEPHATSLPSTEKCSSDRNRLTSGWRRTASRNLAAIQQPVAVLRECRMIPDEVVEQNLHEQPLDLLQKTPLECGNGVMVGVTVGGNEAESHQIIRRPLQFAAGNTLVA